MNTVERAEQDKEEVTIRKAKWNLFLGCFLGLLGFVVLLVGAILDAQDTWMIAILIAACFVCNIVGIILINNSLPGLALSDINKIDQKYGECELTQLHGMKKYEVEQTLRSHKFQYDDNGYYRRKKFSFLRDSVSYYVRILDGSDIEKAIRNEWNHFNQQEHNEKSACLILLIYANQVAEKHTELLRNAGILKIADNMVLDIYAPKTMIVVGVDQSTHIGRYLDMGKGHHLYLYKYGCKMLRKLFGQSVVS